MTNMQQPANMNQVNTALNALITVYTTNDFSEEPNAFNDMQQILKATVAYNETCEFTQEQIDFIEERCIALFDKYIYEM